MLAVSPQLQAIPWYHQGIWIFYLGMQKQDFQVIDRVFVETDISPQLSTEGL